MTKAVIIIPSQGMDTGSFQEVAEAVNKSVYTGEATILRTVVEGASKDALDVKLVNSQGGQFNWEGALGLKTVLTISHAGPLDGPNLSYGSLDEFQGYQPWNQLTPKDLAKKGIVATESVLTEKGQTFWEAVGNALAADGKVILAGCGMGTRDYATLVAHATGRKVYAAFGAFAAGDMRVAVPAIQAIENGGKTTAPIRLYVP